MKVFGDLGDKPTKRKKGQAADEKVGALTKSKIVSNTTKNIDNIKVSSKLNMINPDYSWLYWEQGRCSEKRMFCPIGTIQPQ